MASFFVVVARPLRCLSVSQRSAAQRPTDWLWRSLFCTCVCRYADNANNGGCAKVRYNIAFIRQGPKKRLLLDL